MVGLIDDAICSLTSAGWATFLLPGPDAKVMEEVALDIGNRLGHPVGNRRRGQLVDYLVPKSRQAAKPGSLSACYGLNIFPWHTDGAHWGTPPRFIVMGCLEADSQAADTLICDGRFFAPLNSEAARSSVFRITNGGRCFYAAARAGLDRYYRYDPGCMTPMDAGAQQIMSSVNRMIPEGQQMITWRPGAFLLLDNWRFLHRRTASVEGSVRKLLRVTVMEKMNNG